MKFWFKRIKSAITFWFRRIKSALGWHSKRSTRLPAVLAQPFIRQITPTRLLAIQNRLPKPLAKLVTRIYISMFSNPLRDQTASHLTSLGSFSVDLDEEFNVEGEFQISPDHVFNIRKSGYLFLPVIDWDFRFQRPQQLAQSLSRSGHDVVYVGTRFEGHSTKIDTRDQVTLAWLKGPSELNIYQDWLSESQTKQIDDSIQEILKLRQVQTWTIIVQLPFWADLARRLREKYGFKIVYDCMDDHSGFSTNSKEMLVRENSLVVESDLVIATSTSLVESLTDLTANLALIRNACEYEHFAGVRIDVGKTKTIGYFGAIAEWFDGHLVREVAQLMPEYRFELIGSTFTGDVSMLTDLPNVQFLGEQPYSKLPKLMSEWECCIIPFQDLPITRATNPVKAYEILAAGKPLVSVPLPELLPMSELGLLSLAKNADEFVQRLRVEIETDSVEKIRTRREYALENTWEVRASHLDTEVKKLWPLLSVVVVTYNNLELNRLCVDSLLNSTDYPNLEVVIIDNASSDGTREYLQSIDDPRVHVLLNQENLGFAAANNQGVDISSGTYICLLNNDTIMPTGSLSQMCAYLTADSDLGLIGPVTNAIGNEARIPVRYSNLNALENWATHIREENWRQSSEISMLAFFCVMFTRKTWVTVGPLDESFGIGMYEDDDYNRRVRNLGLEVRLAKDVFVHHWHHASFKLLGEETFFDLLRENGEKYNEKWDLK